MTAAVENVPPGPPIARGLLPLLRFYRQMSTDPLGTVRGRFEAHGDLYFTVSRGDRLFVTRHPDHAHEVLVSRAQSFKKRSVDLAHVLGDGLLGSDGELWRKQRRLIQPAFQRARIARYAEVMVEHTERMLATWKDGDRRDANDEMMKLTLGIVCRTLFDHEVSGQTDTVSRAMTALQETAVSLDLLPEWVPTPLHVRRRRALSALDGIIYGLIDKRSHNDEGPADLLGELLRATDESGAKMPRKQLRDELVTLFLAGHETTSLSLTWTFLLLSENPEVEAQLFAEVDRVLGDRPPTFEDLPQLAFTQRVLMEAMRLYPPAYAIPRLAAEDTELGGFPLRTDDEVVIWVWHMQRDARWFVDPERFDPDRFLPDSGRIRHPHAYMPFGAGQRTCIGRHFAMAEAHLLLAAIARKFKLTALSHPKPRPRVTMGPKGGLPVQLVAR